MVGFIGVGWQKLIGNSIPASLLITPKSQGLSRPPELIPVQVQPLPTAAGAVSGPVVLWHRGQRVEFPAAVSPRWLAELLQCLG